MACVAVISAPKSASTFAYELIRRVAGPFEAQTPFQSIGGRSVLPELDLGAAQSIAAGEAPTIMHVHVLPNENTLSFLSKSGVRPLILWRAIDDAMVSLAEEWERQWKITRHIIEIDGSHLQFLGAVPLVFIDRFMRADWLHRYQMTIDLALPWYCKFIAGWRDAKSKIAGPCSFASYEELVSNPAEAAQRVVQELGLKERTCLSTAVDELLSDRTTSHITVGRAGRGRELLSESQRAQIERVWTAFEHRPISAVHSLE